jgi:hypothetical protein
VRLSQLEADALQLSLFDNAAEEKQLYTAIDDIKNSFGRGAIMRAGSVQKPDEPDLKPGSPLWIGRKARERGE